MLSEELAASKLVVAVASTQIEALQGTLRERDESVHVAAERESELRQSLAKREAEVVGATAADAARVAELAASHQAAVNAARQQVVQLEAQSAAQLEALHSMEGRRAVFDSILRALDTQIAGRDAEQARLTEDLARKATHGMDLTHELDKRLQRIAQLETDVADLNARLEARGNEAVAITRSNDELKRSLQSLREQSAGQAVRIAELEAQSVAAEQAHAEMQRLAATEHGELQAAHATLTAQKAALDDELAALREQSAEHVAAVQQVTAEYSNRLVQIEARDRQVAALAAQVATQELTLQAEIEARRGAEERLVGVENELRVSAATVVSLESQVSSGSMRVEELLHINTRMQADIDEAKHWLSERDALMRRLETEAAHSAAVVDNIRRTTRTPATGNTDAQAVNPETGMRLLVRSKDGHEQVVHVLGRKTSIGRTPDNDLQIDASYISRHHAVILVHGQKTVIEDLNSTNGVHINGRRIVRENLKDGDLVMVGKAAFRFVIRTAASPGIGGLHQTVVTVPYCGARQ